MDKFAFYMHGGSFNRGCEAIVRSTCKILRSTKTDTTLFSAHPGEDMDNRIDLLCEVKPYKKFGRYSVKHVLGALAIRVLGSSYFYYEDLISSCGPDTIAMSIGGDNYCYEDFPPMLAYINKQLKGRGARTVLWGCSIEPDVLTPWVVADLQRYDLITARESITYRALLDRGVDRNTHLFPDPAFVLDRIDLPLPDGFTEQNTVGINISPRIIRLEKERHVTYENYSNLIKHIIDSTDMQIALIPHVLWEDNNDMEPLTDLYQEFQDSGRVVLLDERYNCMELKGYIARCRFLVAARTHASIAAYSSNVPTLVVGYSVKASGIARDIFGLEEHMVLPVQSLQGKDDLVQAFQYIRDHELEIKQHLQDAMPSYIDRVWQAGDEVRKLPRPIMQSYFHTS